VYSAQTASPCQTINKRERRRNALFRYRQASMALKAHFRRSRQFDP
jgi:hypothetical protein